MRRLMSSPRQIFPGSDGAPQIPVVFGVLPLGLQDVRFLADGFARGVTGNLGECGVGILNPRGGVGNHDGFASLLDRSGQEGQIGLAKAGGRSNGCSGRGVVVLRSTHWVSQVETRMTV